MNSHISHSSTKARPKEQQIFCVSQTVVMDTVKEENTVDI